MSDKASNFIFNEIEKDIQNGVCRADEIATRFPPEPNGYLHIGHAKAICINFSVREKYHARTNLRFDDTNPVKEDVEYAEAIKQDIRWLGFQWDALYYASDYFGKMYEYAVELIGKGLAYVDDQTQEEIRLNRGTLIKPGKESPYRNRSAEENLRLFENMKSGVYKNGDKVLRAKIDMSAPNMNMRDPVLYRVLFSTHHNTGDQWCIYPMYDYAHPLEDALEKITHSLCSLEFEDHRPFYDWLLANLDDYKEKRPRQIEFARLNLTDTIMSKRYLKQLVDQGVVDGWDDPRMPTLCGLRRRGVTPRAIRNFCEEIGVSKANSIIDKAQFEYFIRDDLMENALRVMAVLDPVKLTISNYPEERVEMLTIPYRMDEPGGESRKVPFSKHLYIERDDFMEVPAKKYFRLFAGNEVRLMGAYFITCTGFVKDENGEITEIICTYDEKTKSGSGFNERKVKGTIHWVSAGQAVAVTVHTYEDLLSGNMDQTDFMQRVNQNSLSVATAYLEPAAACSEETHFQFVRNGFYCPDSKYQNVYNKTVGLKSTFKLEK